MKQHPILFSAPMVQAILAGTKNQTRRVVKPCPTLDPGYLGEWVIVTKKSTTSIESINSGAYPDACPYGQVGDVLWVRETWCELIDHHAIPDKYVYRADATDAESEEIRQEYIRAGFPYKWKPSIHMPYAAARLFLKITSIRLERLQDISERDAIEEGILREYPMFYNYGSDQYELLETSYAIIDGVKMDAAVQSYRSLWQMINGSDSWKDNPWVWVVEFEPTEKPAT